jgi:hypothetical protein
MLADENVEAFIVAIADQFHEPTAISGRRSRQTRACGKTDGRQRGRVRAVARRGSGPARRSCPPAQPRTPQTKECTFLKKKLWLLPPQGNEWIAVRGWNP